MRRKQFETNLNLESLTGSVIKLCAVFEDRLNYVLLEYFVLCERRTEFHEYFLERMSLIQKLELLQKLNFGCGSKSRENFVSSLKSLRKLRNTLAHNYSIYDQKELTKLYSDENIRRLVLDYPKSLSDEKRNMEVRITRLWKYAHATRTP